MNDARDRVVDALLQAHVGESDESMEARYTRTFARLDNDIAQRTRTLPLPSAHVPSVHPANRARALRVARAALILFAATAIFFLFPLQTNASTLLDAVLSSERAASVSTTDRRYEVEVVVNAPPHAQTDATGTITLHGNWDMRGDESRLDLFGSPAGTLTRVDAHDGAWEIGPDVVSRRVDVRAIWPRWIKDPSGDASQGDVAVEQMDHLLGLVKRSYVVAFARGSEESPAQLRSALHLVASRTEAVRGPEFIDLWIDTDRNVVLEARLVWNDVSLQGVALPGDRAADAHQGRREPPRGDRFGPPPPPRAGQAPPRELRPGGEYRSSPGMLPAAPPHELRLKRVSPISFAPDHFEFPG